MSLHPFHSDRLILNPAGLAGVLTVLHLCMDLKNTLLDKHHYMLFYITAAINPRMLMTVRLLLIDVALSQWVFFVLVLSFDGGRSKCRAFFS